MYDVNPDDIITHKDASKSRKVLYSEFEESLVDAMKRFKVLDPSYVITKDKATDLSEIRYYLQHIWAKYSRFFFASDRLIQKKKKKQVH